MTVRLLVKHKQYPIGSIVTLDAGTEAGLVAAKLADTNLAGGVPYVAPTVPNQRYSAQVEVDASSGAVTGIVNPKTGDTLPLGGQAATISGTGSVGSTLTASLPAGVTGTLQWTRTMIAPPYTKSNISGAVASAVNSLPYTVQAADGGYTLGCDASNTVVASTGVSIPAPPVTIRSAATIMGDSWLDYGNPAASGETSLSFIGWMNDTLRKNGGVGLDAVYLRAVGGTPLSTHLNTQLPLALADNSDIVWYHGGVNSFNPAYSTDTLAQCNAKMASIIQQLAAAKKLVIVDSVNPVWQTGSTGAKGRATEFQAFNAATKTECAKYPNVYYHDQYSLLVDPASTDLNPIADVIQATDGIHPTTLGARLIGEDAAAKIGPLLSSVTKYKTRGANLLPAFTGTGGTGTAGTGTVNGGANMPAGWDVTVASGIDVVTVSDSPTNPGYKRFVITNSATSTASTVNIAVNAATQAALLSALAIGDVVQGGFDFKQIGTSNKLTRVAATLRLGGASGTLWDAMQRNMTYEPDSVLKYSQASCEGRRYFHPYTLTTLGSTPQVEFIISINLQPNSGSVTIDIALPDLFKLV